MPVSVNDISEEFTPEEGETLNEASVNIFRSVRGVIKNFGFRSLSLEDATPAGWNQFTVARLSMAITALALNVCDRYLFAEIDGQRTKLAELEGAVTAEALLPFFPGSLYGDDATEAFSVDATSEEANPDSELALGNVRVLIAFRPSPFAELIQIEVTNVPITTPLAA